MKLLISTTSDVSSILCILTFRRLCFDGAVGSALDWDLRFISCGFEFCLGTVALWPCVSCLHCVPLSPSNCLVPAKSGAALRLEA